MSTNELPPGEPAPELLDGRLWVDGCFDFFHHGMHHAYCTPVLAVLLTRLPLSSRAGHAGAIVQARLLGDELYIGVHSDEAILENKGPTVMNLRERCGVLLSRFFSFPFYFVCVQALVQR